MILADYQHVELQKLRQKFFHSLVNRLLNHKAVKHSDGDAHTNGIESFWAMLNADTRSIFHKVCRQHLGRYVNEFVGRYH